MLCCGPDPANNAVPEKKGSCGFVVRQIMQAYLNAPEATASALQPMAGIAQAISG